MNKSFHIFLFIIYANFVICQVADSFTDGEFTTDPVWAGDIADFIINDKLQLQLKAEAEGTSILYTEIPFLADSISFQVSGQLDFSPSGSNNVRIYLIADSSELDMSNGYFVEIGESGSNDALRFFRQDAGQASLLAVGEPMTVANAPADFNIKVEKSPDGLWTIFSSYQPNGPLRLELEFFDDNYQFEQGYFGVSCNYTSSRADKFYFDDIEITELLPDLSAPFIASADVKNESTVTVCFNETLSQDLGLDQIQVEPNLGTPIAIDFLSDPSCIDVIFEQIITPGTPYILQVNGIEDLSGNRGDASFTFMLQKEIAPGAIVINEILFDPDSGGNDFVEFYNVTDEPISLNGFSITNQKNNQNQRIATDAVIAAKGYLALTEDIKYLEDNYIIKDPNTLMYNDLPAFPNEEGNVSLISEAGVIIDQFDYQEDLHNPLIDDTEGVSLERKDPYQDTNDGNWGSASSISGYATPGYQNSILRAGNQVLSSAFHLKNKVFSPNGDGSKDFLEVEYGLEADSWVLYMKVFDISGNFVKDVYTSELLSTSGTLVWDGTGKNNEKLELGIYILWFEIFSPNGEVKYFRETTVIADFLD